jgi:hypothetical protein
MVNSSDTCEQNGSPLMTTILVTSTMPVKKFSYSSYGLMTYLLKPPIVGPLFLGAISVQKISGTGIVTGSITPGTSATKAGRANLQVSSDIYDNLLAVSTSAGSHGVQLSFDDITLVPVAIQVT